MKAKSSKTKIPSPIPQLPLNQEAISPEDSKPKSRFMNARQAAQFKKCNEDYKTELGLILQQFFTQRQAILKAHNDQIAELREQAQKIYSQRKNQMRAYLDEEQIKSMKLFELKRDHQTSFQKICNLTFDQHEMNEIVQKKALINNQTAEKINNICKTRDQCIELWKDQNYLRNQNDVNDEEEDHKTEMTTAMTTASVTPRKVAARKTQPKAKKTEEPGPCTDKQPVERKRELKAQQKAIKKLPELPQ